MHGLGKSARKVTAPEVAEVLVGQIEDQDLRRLAEKSMGTKVTLTTKLSAFHKLFGLPITQPHQASKDFSHISKARLAARLGLIQEQFIELCEALGFDANITYEAQDAQGNIYGGLELHQAILMTDDRSLPAVATKCEDLKYVITGFELEIGIDPEGCGREVHCANLTRLGEDGKPIYREDGFILKGPDYVPPDCEHALRAWGMNLGPTDIEMPTYPTPEPSWDPARSVSPHEGSAQNEG